MPRIKIRELQLFEEGASMAEIAHLTGQTVAEVEAKIREAVRDTGSKDDDEEAPEA